MNPYYSHSGITLYHGNCLDILPSIETGSVDAVIVDPPFAVRGEEWDTFADEAAFAGFTSQWLTQAYRVSPVIATFFADRYVGMLRRVADEAAIPYRRALIWRKPPGSQYAGASQDGFWFDFEMIQVFGAPKKPRVKAHDFGVLEHRTVIGQVHGCEKPLGLMVKLIEGYSAIGETILDPFAGSGTTLVASKILGRHATGIEAEERWCELIATRLQQEVMPIEEIIEVREAQLSLI